MLSHQNFDQFLFSTFHDLFDLNLLRSDMNFVDIAIKENENFVTMDGQAAKNSIKADVFAHWKITSFRIRK